MDEGNLLKHTPWLVLFLLWVGGTTLWFLFTQEQERHLLVSFENQLERTSDELFRGHLEGRLNDDALPDGVQAFAVYGPNGSQVASWGFDAPEKIGDGPMNLREGRLSTPGPAGRRDFIKVLFPLQPRLNFWEDQDPPPPPPPPP